MPHVPEALMGRDQAFDSTSVPPVCGRLRTPCHDIQNFEQALRNNDVLDIACMMECDEDFIR